MSDGAEGQHASTKSKIERADVYEGFVASMHQRVGGELE